MNGKKNYISVLCLIFAGIALNMSGVFAARHLGLPIYFDSFGTVLAAALGGYLPGIIVGYFSNVLNGMYESSTLYYGFISVLIAVSVTRMSMKGYFTSRKKIAPAIVILALIGGVLGSIMTWLLNGFNIGTEVSSGYAHMIFRSTTIPAFFSQLIADIGVDLLDKALTVILFLLLVRMLPGRLLSVFPLGSGYMKNAEDKNAAKANYRSHSMHTEIALAIGIAGMLMGILAVMIGYNLYRDVNRSDYIRSAVGIADMTASVLPADDIPRYIETKQPDAAYACTVDRMKNIKKAFPLLKYLYVYRIREDGCHVFIDLDTEDTPGGKLGDVVAFESEFQDRIPDLLAGKDIPPIISRGAYGWLLTVYRPVMDSSGKCAAYACVDIPMGSVIAGWAVYLMKMCSVVFGLLFVVCAVVIEYVDRKMIIPLNAMTEASNEFAYAGENRRLESLANIEGLNIKTGNEIENLYHAIVKTTADVTQSENEKKIILENVRQPIALFDEKGIFMTGNETFGRLHTEAGICTKDSLRSPLERRCSLCGQNDNCMLRLTVADGLPHETSCTIGGRAYRVRTQPVRSENGRLCRIVVVFVDVTEINASHKRMEEALAIEQETGRNKNIFISSIGHEIKTPLNAVIGFSDLVSSGTQNMKQVGEYAKSIRESAERLQTLFDTISGITSLDAHGNNARKEPCNVGEMLTALHSSLLNSFTEKNITFKAEIPSSLPRFILDQASLRQILFNLIHNACKYTDKGGIDVSVKWDGSGTLSIACRDTGIGIPADKIGKIFEPFYQVDTLRDEHEYRGHGLGLALAERLARRMNGKLSVVSSPGEGSTFTLELKNVVVAEKGVIPAQSQTNASVPDDFFKSLHVLVLDDIMLNVRVLSKLCEKVGLETYGTISTKEALDILETKNINLILTDMWMPVMNGSEFAGRVRSTHGFETVPIYAVTADAAAKENFDMHAFNGMLSKPMTIERVKMIVNEVYHGVSGTV